jgi:hypothetical protein
VSWIGQPVNGLPAYEDFGLVAHLAKEGVSRSSRVITKPSSETEPNSLNGHANCTVGLFLGILVIPLLLLGLAGSIRISLETRPPRALLNCLPAPRHYDVCTIGSIHQTGVEAG